MTLIVHLLDEIEPQNMEILRGLLDPSIHLTISDILPQPTDFQVLVCGRPTRQQLEASPQLRMLVIPFAGVPEATLSLCREFSGLSVHNLHHNAAPTAEMALALLLAASKYLLPIDRSFRRHDWRARHKPNPSVLLDGKTILLLGFGQIGQRVGRVCHALGMRILAVNRRGRVPASLDYPVEVLATLALLEGLPRCQAIVVTLPLTASTRNLIGERELALLPPGGLLVNVGRGPVIDQQALYHALKSGHLAAAGLDVWYNYPKTPGQRANTPPHDYPFNELENVILSPHRAGGSRHSETLRMEHLAALLNAAARNQTIPNRVDLEAGY